MRNKICCIFNLAPHYRAPIYQLMDKELGCDFYFGDTMENQIEPMRYRELKGFKKILKNKKLTASGFRWQVGAWKLLFMPYKHYIITGSPGILSNWIVALLARLYGKKTYAWTHGIKKPVKTKGDIFNKTFYRLCNKILLYGNYSKKIMMQEGFKEDKLIPIYNSLDHKMQLEIRDSLRQNNIFKNHFDNSDAVIMYIGRIQKSKKLDMLVHALKRLLEEGTCANLLFVGADMGDNEVSELVEELGLSKNVWFYGPCYKEQEIGNLFYNADVCVSPGPVGLTAIHSLGYGCPVITNDQFETQMPEHEAIIPGKNGDFFINDNLDSLVTTIKNWINLGLKTREKIRWQAYSTIDENWNPSCQLKILKSILQ